MVDILGDEVEDDKYLKNDTKLLINFFKSTIEDFCIDLSRKYLQNSRKILNQIIFFSFRPVLTWFSLMCNEENKLA